MSVSLNVTERRKESNAFREDADQFDPVAAKCWPPKDSKLAKILNQTGWGSGFQLPFANEENKALEKELELKQRRLLGLSSNLEDHEEHFKTLKKHFTRVQYDNFVTQSLLTAKLAELQSEEKSTGNAGRVWSKSKAQKKEDERKLEEIQHRVHSKLNEIERRTELVKDLLSISEFNEVALAKWKEHTIGAGQDIMYVKFFSKADERNQSFYEKKELDLSTQQRELLELVKNQAQETMRLQELFARVNREFVKAHNERQETIKSWTRAIHSLKRRELDMEILGNDYCIARQHLRNINSAIWEKEKILESEHRTRKQTEFTIKQLERTLRELNQKLCQAHGIYSTLCTEHLNFQSELSITTGDLASVHKNLRSHDGDMKKFIERGAKVEAEVIVLQSKLDTMSSHMCDSESILEQMQAMLQDQEEACAMAREQKKLFQQYHWERNNEKIEVEQKLKLVLRDILSARTSLNYNVGIGQRKELLLERLTGDLFHTDLTCTQLYARIARITNESANSSYITNQAKLKDMKERLENILAEKRIVNREGSHDGSIRSRIDRDIYILKEKMKKHERILEELRLECPGLEKLLQSNADDLKTTLVSLQLEKVVLKRLQEEINDNQEHICDLSQYRYLLEGAVKDRKVEIESHIALHITAIKSAKEQIQKLKSYVTGITNHIYKQKRAFHLLSSLLAVDPSSSSTRGFNSFTASVLRIVEERETLNREKYTWEQKILEAELELRGLENNLKLMETSNCNFKSSLAPALEESIETEKIQKAEAVTQAAQFRKKHSMNSTLKCRSRIYDLQNAINVMRNHVYKMTTRCDEKARVASRLTNAAFVQRDKITRWANLSSKLLQDVRGSLSPSKLFLIQQDLKLRCLEEKLEYAVLMLEKFILEFPESKDLIMEYLMQESGTEELGARVSESVVRHPHENPMQYHIQNIVADTTFGSEHDLLYGKLPNKTILKNRVTSGYVHF